MNLSTTMVLLTVFATQSHSQPQGVRPRRSPYFSWQQSTQRYDASHEQTVEAKIRRTGLVRFLGTDRALYLILDKDEPGLFVLMGPVSYLASTNFIFARGFQVTCTGSRDDLNGQKIMIARQVKLGDRILVLRDQHGNPVWGEKGLRPPPKEQKP